MDRENNFDLLRLLAAISVIFSHAFLTGEGRQDHEPLMWLSGGQCVLGVAGVFVFFTISGYLVSASFQATRSAPRFLAKRALRVYPGLALCVLLSAFALGPALTSLPLAAYFSDRGPYAYVVANLLMDANHNSLPGVSFSGFAAGSVVDGPLWSLPCEVVMYLMLAGLGALGWLRLEVSLALLGLGLGAVALDSAQSDYFIGTALWLLPFFAAGMVLHQLRDKAIFAPKIALLAGLGLALTVAFGGFILFFPIFGSYLVLYVALERRLPVLRAARFGDLSYGLYIYGWPVEQLVVRMHGGTAPWWLVFAVALPASGLLALLSWHLVERPALALKPRAAPRASLSYVL